MSLFINVDGIARELMRLSVRSDYSHRVLEPNSYTCGWDYRVLGRYRDYQLLPSQVVRGDGICICSAQGMFPLFLLRPGILANLQASD